MDDTALRETKPPDNTLSLGRVGIFNSCLTALRRWVYHCPRCDNNLLRRSRPRSREFLLRLIFVRAYRCHNCYRRYWRPRFRI